jgi:phosphocarrier protein HPr
MIRRVICVGNELGLHARPAAELVKTASRYQSRVTLVTLNRHQETDGKSILGVMLLGASCGTELEVIVEGIDEESAMEAIQALAEKNFNELK